MKTQENFCGIFSDVINLRIMNMLLHEEHCMCNFISVLVLSRSVISRYLDDLESAGLVSKKKSGMWDYYRSELDEETEGRVRDLIRSFDDETVFAEDFERLGHLNLCSTDNTDQ